MNTDKKKASSFPAGTFTNDDIKALREYVDSLEAIAQEEPQDKLTPEEWDEAMKEIHRTGKIPAKYAGRIGENEVEVRDGLERVLDDNGEPILDDEGKPRYKHVVYDKPKKQKAYYDIAEEAHNKKIARLQTQYHDIIVKAILNTPAEAADEKGFLPVMDLIRELLKNPVVLRELEKELKAGQFTELAPLGSVPNGEIVYWLIRTLNSSKGGRMVQASTRNRHEEITTLQKGDSLRFVRENKQTKTTQIVEMKNALKYLGKTKTFVKLLIFSLQKMTAQNFPLEVGFSLQELVTLGVYENTSNARRAVKKFFEQQLDTPLSGTLKKGKRIINERESVLFYDLSIDNGFVTLSANPKINMEFIANYFTVFPRFAYALNGNAFSLVHYIFFLARQKAQDIKDKGTFTISLEAVREYLGLPSVDEVNNRKYRQYIIEPIEKAIEETEEALRKVPEAAEYGFTITPYGTDTSNIRQWLQGYLEIGLKGDFAETFIRLATKAEKDRAQWEKVKQAELARIAARAEAKEAQEEKPKSTRGRRKKA